MAAGRRIAGRVECTAVLVDVEHDRCADGGWLGLEVVAAAGEFVPGALIDAVVDGQRSRLFKGLLAIGVGVKRVLVVVGGKARRGNGGFWLQIELDEVEQ